MIPTINVTRKPKVAKTYTTLQALVRAKANGRLPQGLHLFFDGGDVIAGSDVNFTMDQREFMTQALALFGFKTGEV